MTKTKAFTHNGRKLEVRAVSGAHNTWVVSVLDAAGLTVSTTGSIPRWTEPDPARPATGPHATVDSLMDQIIADVNGGRLPLLPST
jgi:hypothetical protein